MMKALTAILGIAMCAIAGSAERPNIILVMADDLGWGDPSYNNGWIQTPALDAMAAEGLRFDRFYSASAVCSPTRASCLTGRNPLRVGIPNANTGRLGADETPLSEVLDEAGYATGHFGKWHLGTLTTLRNDSNRGAPGNTAVYSPPWLHGYDDSFATEAKVPTFHPMRRTINGLPEPTSFTDPNFYGTRYWTNPADLSAPEGRVVQVDDNLSGDDSRVIMDRVIPFIRDAVSEGDPFFAVIWFHTPHKPLPDPDGSFPVDSSESYTKAIIDMDTQIARLREELESEGVAEETMLWFCSDNGPENGVGSAGPFRERKRSLHEGGVRVPGILVWPEKVTTARTTSFPAVTSDYYPTILDYLDLSVPDQKPIDGISLRGLIEEDDAIREEPIGFQYLQGRSWVNQQYKLISKNGGVSFELYDLLADPGEQANIASTHPDVVARMSNEYQTWAAAVASDTEYVPPEESVSVILETSEEIVTGPFEVAVTFGEDVTGLEEGDFVIVNGMSDGLIGGNAKYTLLVTPLVEGRMNVQLPAGAVVNDDSHPNLASNSLDLFFSTGGEAGEGTILFDDHFDNESTLGWVGQGNAVAASHEIVAANSILESTVNATAQNSNRGIVSDRPFDPGKLDGFSVTFVVDRLEQSPEVNGFFLGVVGDKTVFYRDRSTRNFGVTFFGIESRTNSSGGFGLNFGDNFGAAGAEIRLDSDDIELASLLDGFTMTLGVNAMGWRLDLFGLEKGGGISDPVARRGTWADAGTNFDDLFGEDSTWHVVSSNQRTAAGGHTVAFERIRLVAGREPAPEILDVGVNPAGGGVSIAFASIEGRRYWLERSLDLKSWTEVSHLDARTRLSEIVDEERPGFRAFYRLRQ